MRTRTDIAPATADTRQALVQDIEAHIAREGLSRTGFGLAALGDPSLVRCLARGSDVCLHTADRVLAFLGEEPLGPRFRREVTAFLRVTRIKPSLFGKRAMGNSAFATRLRRGLSPRLATVDRTRAWMAENASAPELEAVRAAVEDGPPAAPTRAADEEETDRRDDYMTTKQAAGVLGLSPRTLDRYRGNGKGPAFHRFGGCVRYRLADVKAWASERRRRSTSDDGPSGPP